MNRVPVIDTHNHVVPPGAIEAVVADPDRYGAKLNPENERGASLTWADDWGGNFFYKGGMSQWGYPPERLSTYDAYANLDNAKAHLKRIDADGAVFSTFMGWHRYTLPEQQKLALCRLLNDETAKWITGEPMLKAMATLPLPDGDAAAEELRRTNRDLNMVGAMIQTNLQAEPWNLDDARLEPLWQAAQDLDVPLYLHPSGGANPNVGSERLGGWGLNFLGNAIETTIAASYLIASGVMDRFPDLKLVLPHGGGYLSVAYGRVSHYYHVQPETTGKVSKQEASQYLQRFYYDSILHRPESLTYLIKLVGAERVVFGTDYPFTNEPPDPVNQIRELDISQAERDAALGSAAKLYGFV